MLDILHFSYSGVVGLQRVRRCCAVFCAVTFVCVALTGRQRWCRW